MPIITEAVIQGADFEPSFNGESYITLTFRAPVDTQVVPGVWELKPSRKGTFPWAIQKHPEAVE